MDQEDDPEHCMEENKRLQLRLSNLEDVYFTLRQINDIAEIDFIDRVQNNLAICREICRMKLQILRQKRVNLILKKEINCLKNRLNMQLMEKNNTIKLLIDVSYNLAKRGTECIARKTAIKELTMKESSLIKEIMALKGVPAGSSNPERENEEGEPSAKQDSHEAE